jgi:hypothetical protein
VDCLWAEWTEAGCSATCGPGQRIRQRKRAQAAQHGGQECTGRSYDLNGGDCSSGCCPQDCAWSTWSWEACSVSCGDGTRRGRRTVARSACGGGKDCQPDGGDVISSCNQSACPPECQWGPWGSWSEAVIVDAFRLGGGLTRSRSSSQIGGPACLETRTEYEPLEPIAKDAENDETVAAAGRSEAALWVTPTILILILLLLLLLLLIWLCFYCRKTKDKSAGMVVFSTKQGNKDDGIEVQCRARI